MTQRELNREVAQATSESVGTIARMGFVPLTFTSFERDVDFEMRGDADSGDFETGDEPLFIDWDEWESQRNFISTGPVPSQRNLEQGSPSKNE